MREKAIFGSGGNPKNFYSAGFKETCDVFKWLNLKKIESYEYQAGNGIHVSKDSLKKMAERAKKFNIKLSFHAPYFISLAATEELTQKKSINQILSSISCAETLGADIIVVHCGGLCKQTREIALEKSKILLSNALEILCKTKETSVKIGLETMGKVNQLGTLEEVLELCKIDKKIFAPVVDFGHLNARDCGRFENSEDYLKIFENIGENLSDEHAKFLHCHFSKIEYTKGGEKKHLTFADKQFGPEFEPLAKVLAEQKLCPNIICESDGTMDIDAIFMKECYEKNMKTM